MFREPIDETLPPWFKLRGFRVLGFRVYRGLGFRALGFRACAGFRVEDETSMQASVLLFTDGALRKAQSSQACVSAGGLESL